MNRLTVLIPLLCLSLSTGCISVEVPLFGGSGPLQERLVLGEEGDKILLLDISGPLSEQGDAGRFGVGGSDSVTARIREQLERASQDDEIKALLLRINSPGGTVTASEILYGEIARFKAKRDVPVVAQMMGVAASGGYYVAMTADHVQAYPTTITGSIGVLFAGFELSGLMEKLGVVDQTLVTGEFKDAGSPLRPLRDAEREQLGSVIEDLFDRFLGVVDAGRPELTRERIAELADGRIYSASQAHEAGLIDSVGDLPAAVDIAREKAGLEEARVIRYLRPGRGEATLFSAETQPLPETAIPRLPALAGPAFLYLWMPGGV